MTRLILILTLAASVSACASFETREARCQCFTDEGSPTGNCDFTALPQSGPGIGREAVFKIMAERSSRAMTLGHTMRSTKGSICNV